MKKMNIKKYISTLMTIVIMLFNVVSATGGATSAVNSILGDILSVLLGVSGAVCVGKLIHIGILYMTSSAMDKSNAKSAVLPWLIGTIVCFGAAWIGPWIIDIFRVDGNVLDIQ